MVNLIHKCSLKPNYIARGIVSSVIEGDIVQFKPLDRSEFGILIQKVFLYCEECGLSEGCLIRWPANHLLDLNDVPLDVILKMNTEEDMVNFWNIFEECPLQMVLPGDSISDDVKINTTRPYNSVKRKVRTIISKRKSSSPYKVGIDEATSFAKLSKEKCCSGLCI